MKRILTALTIAMIVFSACEEKVTPEITVNPANLEASFEGQSFTVDVTANCDWVAVSDLQSVQVSPAAGKESAKITVTVAPNPENMKLISEICFYEKDDSTLPLAKITVTQNAFQSQFDVEGAGSAVSFEGGTVTLTITSNCPWRLDKDESSPELAFNIESGEAGESSLEITVPETTGIDVTKYDVVFYLPVTEETIGIELSQEPAAVEYGGAVYPFKKMNDGRIWMTKNLRYVPEGMNVSADPAENAGIWYPDYGGTEAKTDKDSVDKYGLLYDTFTALGIKQEDVNESNFQSFEGIQGICPEGWHIPTEAEFQALQDANFDADQDGAAIVKLEEIGFNTQFGGFRQQNNSGMVGKYAKMEGYLMSSTSTQYKVNQDTGAITYTNKGFMKLVNNKFQRIKIALLQNFSGSTVRCIKDEAE